MNPQSPIEPKPKKNLWSLWVLVSGFCFLAGLLAATLYWSGKSLLDEMSAITEGMDGPEGKSGEGADRGADFYSVVYALEAVQDFRNDVGRYPTAEEGFAALVKAPKGAKNWDGPYAHEGVEVDLEGNPLLYELTADYARITSMGDDGKPGGKGENADYFLQVNIDKSS